MMISKSHTNWLLSIDPGLRACGCALWQIGTLRAAEWVRADSSPSDSLTKSIDVMIEAVHYWLVLRHLSHLELEIVIELPQTYGGHAAQGDANVLIELAAVVGALQAMIGAPTQMVRPHEWKGSTPKFNNNGENLIEQRCRAGALSREELALIMLPRGKKSASNVWDAIGIGLWWLKKSRHR